MISSWAWNKYFVIELLVYSEYLEIELENSVK